MAFEISIWVGTPGPPFSVCVTLDEFISLCKFLFSHLSMGIIVITTL